MSGAFTRLPLLCLFTFLEPKKILEEAILLHRLATLARHQKVLHHEFWALLSIFSQILKLAAKVKSETSTVHPPALIPMSKTAWSRHQIYFLFYFFLLRPSTAFVSCKSALVRNRTKNWGNSVSSNAFWDNFNLARALMWRKLIPR